MKKIVKSEFSIYAYE